MNIRPISQWTLYRHRFGITYACIALFVIGLLTLLWQYVPPGLSDGESLSVIGSHAISYTAAPTNVVDLPFHMLQQASVWWLGVSPLGVRLPSLAIGAVTALCMALLLRRLFRHNIATLATVLVLGSAWFLSLARLGTPAIMIPFWSTLLLLSATYVSQQTPAWRWWKVAFAGAAALSLYTPFMVYLLAAAMVAAIWQPHLRYLLREANPYYRTLAVGLFILLIAPAGWGFYNSSSQIWQLLAIPTQLPGPIDFAKNLWQAGSSLLNPFAIASGPNLAPLLSLPMVVLLGLGAWRLLKHYHSVRAYLLLVWCALLVPIIGFNPNSLTVLFVPAMLGITIGTESLIAYWYRLFPRNPYARLFGLIPLIILMLSIAMFNYQRYFYGQMYSENAVSSFSQDAFLAQQQVLDTKDSRPLTLVVPAGSLSLYKIIAEHRPNTQVTTAAYYTPAAGRALIGESELNKLQAAPTTTAAKLLVTSRANDALRFRLYNL